MTQFVADTQKRYGVQPQEFIQLTITWKCGK